MLSSRLSQLHKCSGLTLRKLSSGSVVGNGFTTMMAAARRSDDHDVLSMMMSRCSFTTAVSSLAAAPARCQTRLNSPTFRNHDEFGLLIRGLSSNAAAPVTTTTVVEHVPIPPNLHFDPKSSFASRVRAADAQGDKASTKAAAATATHSDDAEVDENDDEDDDVSTDAMMSVLAREVAYVTPLPDRLRAIVHDVRDGSEVGSIWLNDAVFGRDPIRIDLLKRAVDYHRAKKRGRRNAATKTISQVSGSGRKLRQQKGTGRARVGHGRPPHFRGGAKAHGPKNATDYGNTKLNKKVRKQALCHALSQKLKENNVVILNDLNVPSHKTRELVRILQQWNVGGDAASGAESALVLDHYFPDDDSDATAAATTTTETATDRPPSYRGVPANLYVASRNIPRIVVGNANKANVYELLRKDKLVLTLEALSVLEKRLKDY